MVKPKSFRRVKRFEVWILNFDPTIGSEVKKTRPAVIISPDQMNAKLQTVIVSPLTSIIKTYPSRIPAEFENRSGEIMLDQLRTVDKSRLIRKVGRIPEQEAVAICQVLEVMFRR